ncbi:MAG: heme ABC transporter permease CcmC [Paracoccaceae bacterium]|nr:MAG: transcriptional regulator [Alphaproteobacteria bacterium]|tara:strand:+ start:1164 stop:1880 length:717 start_codon:yes stop_codon:yes gene_type:complete
MSNKFWKFSNPVLFKKLSGLISPLAGIIAILAIIPGLVWGVFFTNPDYKQMETVKIIFIHVPAAFLAINIYLMMTITSLIWLVRRHYVSALAAKSAAIIGLTMTIVTIITGSLWGSSTWGTYWVWDPRLTSFAILLCFYVGYILLWQAIGSLEKAANITSLFCIIGSVFALLSRYIVFFIDQGLHQGPTLSLDQEKNIDNSYYFPLILMLIGFSSLFIYLVLVRTTTELNKFKLKGVG